MPATEAAVEKPQPEAVSASKAEQRLSSRDGRPVTNHSTSSRINRAPLPNSRGNGSSRGISSPRVTASPENNLNAGPAPPENTPREKAASDIPPSSNWDGASQANTHQNGTSIPSEEPGEEILEEDELFMTLTEEERKEWDAMMLDRSNQLEQNRNSYKTWSENFTRRRMFAYSRMRKLIMSYKDRSKLLSEITCSLNNHLSKQKNVHTSRQRQVVTKERPKSLDFPADQSQTPAPLSSSALQQNTGKSSSTSSAVPTETKDTTISIAHKEA